MQNPVLCMLNFYEICRLITSFRLSFFSSLVLSIRQPNSLTSRSIVVRSPFVGQQNRPRANRLKYSSNPSHSRIFILFLSLLQNTNSASANGSREKLSCTSAISPLIEFLVSVYMQQRCTGFVIPSYHRDNNT